MTLKSFSMTRRDMIGGAVAAIAALALAPSSAWALNEGRSMALVDKIVADINRVIASGKSQGAMIKDFERIFGRYADVGIIARSALGADSKRATPAQMRAFTNEFKGYVARKYGKRFREFIGGRIEVNGVRQVKSWHEVKATAYLKGQSPFEVLFLVSDRSGKDLFFDMVIEGVSMRLTERTEIGALLDANNGDIDRLVNAMKTAG